jgi:hypothetical protein
MTTKLSGGKITGLLALSLEAEYAGEIGDYVHVTGDYECNLADGTKPVLGKVSVSNKGRVGSDYPVAVNPGPVTVDTVVAGGVIPAGSAIGPDPANPGRKFVAVALGAASSVGIALTGAGASGTKFDALFR